jgi:hypothetical protein
LNTHIRYCLVVTLFFTIAACAIHYPKPSAELKIENSVVLPLVLAETSGLYCEDEVLYSLNDSGNAPVVFSISRTGSVNNEDKLALTNRDWEAISADDKAYYIADVGNNKGRRATVSIYKVSSSDVNDFSELTLQYANNDPSANMPYAHDYDAEAMVKAPEGLLLFSKSWRSGVAHVYRINEGESSQILNPIADIEGLPGVITGADFDKKRNLYVFTGYKSDPFGNFSAFLAQVSTTFSVINVWPLKSYKQVEGVCVDSSGDYWFSEEATEGRQATLNRAVVR